MFTRCENRSRKTIYYQDSNDVKSVYYLVNGKKDGKEFGYYKNGKLWAEVNWKNGQLDGEMIQFNENGSTQSERLFREGKPIGESRYYSSKGYLAEVHYHDSLGRFVDFRRYTESGERIDDTFVLVSLPKDTLELNESFNVYMTLGNVLDMKQNQGKIILCSDFLVDKDNMPTDPKDTLAEIVSINNTYEVVVTASRKGKNTIKGMFIQNRLKSESDSVLVLFFSRSYYVR